MTACLCGTPCGAWQLVLAMRPVIPELVAELWAALERGDGIRRDE